jgi:hypothetical protein
LRSIGRPAEVGRVLNLSQDGILVAATGLRPGEVTGIELHGPHFRYAGVAKVAHRSSGKTGL